MARFRLRPLATPASHMLAYVRVRLLGYAKGAPDSGFRERNNDC